MQCVCTDSTVRVSTQCVCTDSTVRVSTQCMYRQYGTCQHAVYVQTVPYVSAGSVYVQTVRYLSAGSVYVQTVRYVSACSVYVQTVRYMSARSVYVQTVWYVSARSMYVQTVWYVSACSVFQKAFLIPSVNDQPQCLSTKLQLHLYCRVRLNNPAHHHKCCDVSTQPLFTSHSAVNFLDLWLAMASAATCDNKIFHNYFWISNSLPSHDSASQQLLSALKTNSNLHSLSTDFPHNWQYLNISWLLYHQY